MEEVLGAAKSHDKILHIRADRSTIDFHNTFKAPFLELFEYKELIRNIVSRDLKKRYKRSFLGIAWTIIAPLMSMLVLWTVFTHALKVQVENYAAYLLSGIITWNLFLQSSSTGAQAIILNAPLIQKIRLPRVVFPVSAVFNNIVNFCFAFCALIIVMLISKAPFHWTIFMAPIMLIPLLLFITGWAMLVSALSVFFRDLQYMLEIGLGALFYATPILWEPKVLPPQMAWIVSWNPMAKFIHLFRCAVTTGELPALRTYLVSLSIGSAIAFLGWIMFQRLQRRFVYWL